MTRKVSIRRYCRVYARLVQLYPREFRERFAAPMVQTFEDALREAEAGPFVPSCGMFAETFLHIIRERLTMHRRQLVRILLVTAAVLAVPLVAMQFSAEVNWSPGDVLIAGLMLIAAGTAYEFVAGRLRRETDGVANTPYRVAGALAVLGALALVWINLAVGIIGNEGDAANLLYVSVLIVGLIGALSARFEPAGMERALWATTAAQALVTGVTVTLISSDGPTLAMNGGFVLLWAAAAMLFRAARPAVARPAR